MIDKIYHTNEEVPKHYHVPTVATSQMKCQEP